MSGTPSYMSFVRAWMKDLWDFTRECNELGNSVSFPTYVCTAFTNPGIISRIRWKRDLLVFGIGRCVGALVVNKLAADINSRNVPASDDELACLSAILGTQSDDLRLCLRQSGTIELVNLASLALGDVSSLQADQMPPDTYSVFQHTLAILSEALPSQQNVELPQDQTVALVNVSDYKFERIIVPRLHDLLVMCTSGTLSLMEERTSCLRECLKTLWHCGKACHDSFDPLPSYFPLLFSRPEITRHLRYEHDLVAHITGSCFGALIVCKLVGALKPPISFSDSVSNPELACISAILGAEHREVLLSPYQLRFINFRNVVSRMSDKIDTFTAAGMSADVSNITLDTLYILAMSLGNSMASAPGVHARDQWELIEELHTVAKYALDSSRLKDDIMAWAHTLYILQDILNELSPGVE